MYIYILNVVGASKRPFLLMLLLFVLYVLCLSAQLLWSPLNIVIINLLVTNSLLKTLTIFSYLVTSGVNSTLFFLRRLRSALTRRMHHKRFVVVAQ